MTSRILDPLHDGISSIELIRTSGDDLDIVNAARVSYGRSSYKLSDRDNKLLKYLLKNGHTSPFEHTQLLYKIKVPIYILRQWMRHRVGVSYNEISGRYSKMSMEFYIPQKWRIQDPVNKQGSIFASRDNDINNKNMYIEAITMAKDTYNKLLDEGVCRELARGVLPNCLYTEFVFTCNLVSLFHFVRLRLDSHAQWEIQQYALGLVRLAKENFPVSISHWIELNNINIREEKGTLAVKNISKEAIR